MLHTSLAVSEAGLSLQEDRAPRCRQCSRYRGARGAGMSWAGVGAAPVHLHPEICTPLQRQTADLVPWISVASNLDEVIQSWQLVYQAYVTQGLIEPNEQRLHTWRQMVSPDSVVIQGRRCHRVDYTLSAVIDGPHGLPLDSAYPAELDQLRCAGRKLVEVGLFAHNPEAEPMTAAESDSCAYARRTLIELTSYACAYGLSAGVTDFVIGVHPHHAPAYCRLWGFEAIAEVRSYAAVKDRPVVLLHGDWERVSVADPRPAGVARLQRHPVSPRFFAGRYRFPADALEQDAVEMEGLLATAQAA